VYQHQSIKDYHHQLNAAYTSCVEVAGHYLSRISQTKKLNAFIEVFAEEALLRAKELDDKKAKGLPTGKLFGVVVGIKDVISYKDHRLTAGSKILNGFHSLYNATAIERLLKEDAIIIGNLNCDEFAMGSSNENSSYGKVLNALDENRVPGGSSGGSAVAVQAGLCMVSLGSDTGGSVRQPADFCGIVGLKPTYGRISRYGLIAYASSFDQIGIFANNTEDAALLLEVMAGADEFDSTVSHKPVPAYSDKLQSEKKFRIAYFKEALQHPSLDAEISSSIHDFIDQLKEEKHVVDEVDFEYLDHIVPAYYVLTTAEASSNLSRYDGVKFGYRSATQQTDLTEFYRHTRSEGFGREVKRRIMLGTFVLSAGYYDAYYTRAQKIRQLIHLKTQSVFKDYDAIIMPTVPAPAFRFGEKTNDPVEMFLADLYTVYANLAGVPAISIPLFRHSNGMPFGLQVICNHFEELTLLRLSKYCMEMAGNEVSRQK
jgi:aspartyl-tRNA(Asn)/glutamyl-tRNA(Gln) amidotransferase subunit A